MMGRLFVGSLFRTGSDFRRLSWINVAIAVVGLPLVTLVWWFGYAGLCLRITLIWVVGSALFYWLRPIKVRCKLRFSNLRVLLFTGLPIFAVGHLFALWPTINATLVLSYGGKESLGLFAIANMAGPIATTFPLALASVVYPRMAQEYGRTGSVSTIAKLAIKPTFMTLAFTAVIVVAGWIAIPWVVEWLLPKYKQGIAAAQWTIASALVVGLSPINNVFNVVKKQVRYACAMIAGMGAYYATLRILLSDSLRLEAFPQAMLVGRSVFMIICALMVWHLTRQPIRPSAQ